MLSIDRHQEQYQVGDKVRCIDSYSSNKLLEIGKVYTIVNIKLNAVSYTVLYLEGVRDHWIECRFEFVE